MSTTTTWEIQIVTHSIHIRKDPVYKQDGSNVVGYAFNGNKFTASKYQNGWFYVDSKKGWMKEIGSADKKTYIKVLSKNTISTAKTAETVKKEAVKEVVTETPKNTNSTANTPKTQTFTAESVNNPGNLISLSSPKQEVSIGVDGNRPLGINRIDIDGDDDVSPNYYQYQDQSFNYNGVDGDDDYKSGNYPHQDKNFKYNGVDGDDGTGPNPYTNSKSKSLTDPSGPAARWASKGSPENARADKTILTAMTGANIGGLHFNEKWGSISNSMDMSYSSFEKDLVLLRHNHNVFNDSDKEKHFTHFNRFRMAIPDMALHKTIPYVFFTRPELSIVTSDGRDLSANAKGDHLFTALYNDQPKLFHNLDSAYHKNDNFNLFLSNSAMSFQTSDEVLKTLDHGETYTGWKMVYGRHTNESNTAGQFSIQYIDDYNYNVYKMHKLWISYIDKVYRGEVGVSREVIWQKILTYPCSVYYVVCAPDGETILFWSKYFGVFPINTPASASSFTHNANTGFPEFSINYIYSIKEDMNPVALNEFNLLSSGQSIYRETYNPDVTGPSRTFVGSPYIDIVDAAVGGVRRKKFKLRFRNG